MNTLETIRVRKSVRTYLNRSVELGRILQIVEAGDMAPKTSQVFFNIVTQSEKIEKWSVVARQRMLTSGNAFLAQMAADPGYCPLFHAPLVIIMSVAKSDNPITKSMGIANSACAAENMLLAATELGLGSCYLVAPMLAFEDPEIRSMMQIREGLQPICAVALGYTEDTTPHAPRKAGTDNILFVDSSK